MKISELPLGSDREGRIIWSLLAEPEDLVAGTLINSLGAVEALKVMASGRAGDISTAESVLRDSGTAGMNSRGQIIESLHETSKRIRCRLDTRLTSHLVGHVMSSRLETIVPGDEYWPEQLRSLGSAQPYLLWANGNLETLKLPSLVVTGARACTAYGAQVAAEIAGSGASSNAAVLAGAAYGIDAAAHRVALAMGVPTIAALAGAADRPYPRAHDVLLDQIASAGLVLSETPPGFPPTRWRFMARNRLMAGLSSAAVVVEAGARSGALDLAARAKGLDRPLGVVPGPVTSAASAGCHELLRSGGATLVRSGDDAWNLLKK